MGTTWIKKYRVGELVTLGHKGWASGPHDWGIVLGLSSFRPEIPYYEVFLCDSKIVRQVPWDWLEAIQ